MPWYVTALRASTRLGIIFKRLFCTACDQDEAGCNHSKGKLQLVLITAWRLSHRRVYTELTGSTADLCHLLSSCHKAQSIAADEQCVTASLGVPGLSESLLCKTTLCDVVPRSCVRLVVYPMTTSQCCLPLGHGNPFSWP